MKRIEPRGRSSGALLLLLSIALSLCGAACDSGPDWGMPPATKDRPNPAPATQNLDATKSLYEDRCARCHGDQGAGDGSDAKLYKPLPSSLVSEQVRQSSDGELFWKIGKGRRPMPSYAGELQRGPALGTRQPVALLRDQNRRRACCWKVRHAVAERRPRFAVAAAKSRFLAGARNDGASGGLVGDCQCVAHEKPHTQRRRVGSPLTTAAHKNGAIGGWPGLPTLP